MYLAGQIPSSTGMSDLKLLISNSNDFTDAATIIIEPTSYNAITQIVSFDNVIFTSGQYFTLVTDLTNEAPGGVLDGLYTWNRADKGVTTSGTFVGTWADQGPAPKNVTQAVATTLPGYNTAASLINFNPTLGFDGTDVMMSAPLTYSGGAGGEDIFAVVLPANATGLQTVVGLGTSTATTLNTELRFNAGKLEYGSNANVLAYNTASNGRVQLANMNRASGTAYILLDGVQVSTGALAPTPAITQLNLGSRRYNNGNAQFFNGQIAETIIYSRQLDNTERQKVASYLAIKYGITLSHNYVDPGGVIQWDSTANYGYGFNITGIGRDDCNGLHQRQSKSINTAQALITLGNGMEIASANAANANPMNNNTALLLGDDNGSRTAWSTTGAPVSRERLPRTWKVQETGTIGTVTISVPTNSSVAAVRLPLERDGAAYLLVNSSADFTSGTIEVPMSLNGDNWEATYDFSTGDYFTFATNDVCVASEAVLSDYNAETTAATDKCYVDGWILFKDPVDGNKYIAAIYDPNSLIDRTLIAAKVDANAAFTDIGKTDGTKAIRLMRRLLQIDCNSCFNAVANPAPGFVVRMFYGPDEKAGSENGEANNIEDIKLNSGITEPQVFKWFKVSDKTTAEVVSELTPDGVAGTAGGQEWQDGALPVGQIDGVDYVDFIDVNGFSTFGGTWLANSNIVLPVTFTSFEASRSGNHSLLNWKVAVEENVKRYQVQHSTDNRSWQPIGYVAAKSAAPVNTYSFTDMKPAEGINYYRIVEEDKDGRLSYSIVRMVRFGNGGFAALIYPVPVIKELTVEIQSGVNEKAQLRIMDMQGKVLYDKPLQLRADGNMEYINVAHYRPGVYVVELTSARTKWTSRFTRDTK
jgi:hypothetical protein